MMKTAIVGKHGIGRNKRTHHYDYYLFLSNFYPDSKYYDGRFSQVAAYATLGRLILLDFEYNSFKFWPFVLLRDFLFLRTDVYAVSISNWALKGLEEGRMALLRLRLKKFVFQFLANRTRTRIFHTVDDQRVTHLYGHIFTDFQYWDLPYLRSDEEYQTFKKSYQHISRDDTLVYIGRFDRYRGSDFLYFLCQEHETLPFKLLVWSGNIESDFLEIVEERKEIIIIQTTPSSSDIVNAHLYFKNFLLYYPSSKRTSGYFGRGIQAGNYLYVSPKFYSDSRHPYLRVSKFKNTKELFECFAENRERSFTENIVCHYDHKLD